MALATIFQVNNYLFVKFCTIKITTLCLFFFFKVEALYLPKEQATKVFHTVISFVGILLKKVPPHSYRITNNVRGFQLLVQWVILPTWPNEKVL